MADLINKAKRLNHYGWQDCRCEIAYGDPGHDNLACALRAYVHDQESELAYGSETILLGYFIQDMRRWDSAPAEERVLMADWWIDAYDSYAEYDALPPALQEQYGDDIIDNGILNGDSHPAILDDTEYRTDVDAYDEEASNA